MPIPGKMLQTIVVINKSQTPNSKILSMNLTHQTMKTPQNVLKMSRDTSRETTTPLTDGCNNN